MNKNILSILIAIIGIFIFGVMPGFANAQTAGSTTQIQQTPSSLQYPIKELGDCQSKEDCSVFCDKPENSDACLTFAGQHNLMSSNEVAVAKKFIDNGMVGPGGCKGQDKCSQYCGNSDHLEECTNFAQKNGMMSDQQLQDSKKVLAAMKNGLKPPACSGPQQCNAYCGSPKHMEECMTFSLAAGIVPDDQKAQMQKTLDAMKQGIKPPACQPTPPPDQAGQLSQVNQSSGLESCDTYCGNPSHTEECMTFSLAAGMVPDSQKAQMQKTLDVLKQGIKPPACQPNQPNQSVQPSQANQPSQSGQGLQSCDEYCSDSSHVEECVKFSVAVGNMTETQAQSAIKTGGKGPGGCVGKDACDTFCNNPDNQDTCFNFAKDNGMIPGADLQKMQDSQNKMKDAFSSIPPEVLDCLTSSVGDDVVEKMKTGSVIGRQYGDSINQCFQKFNVREGTPNGKGPGSDQGGQSGQNQNGQGQTNQQGQPNQQNQAGQQGYPGDKFQSGPGTVNPGGQQMPQQAGPGGCKGPEECKAYCESHQEECKNFQPQQNQPGQQQGQMQPGQQCEGENCQRSPNQLQPGQPGQPGGAGGSGQGGPNQGQGFNPGSGQNGNGPGSGQGGPGQSNQPGQQPGQMQPQQQPQPQQQQKNPLPPPVSFINKDSFVGSLIDAALKFLTGH
jgi:hypothetical protein